MKMYKMKDTLNQLYTIRPQQGNLFYSMTIKRLGFWIFGLDKWNNSPHMVKILLKYLQIGCLPLLYFFRFLRVFLFHFIITYYEATVNAKSSKFVCMVNMCWGLLCELDSGITGQLLFFLLESCSQSSCKEEPSGRKTLFRPGWLILTLVQHEVNASLKTKLTKTRLVSKDKDSFNLLYENIRLTCWNRPRFTGNLALWNTPLVS